MAGLSFKRIAGGSVIDNPPLFSENGDKLFIIITRSNLTRGFATEYSVSTVRAYSTSTGEWICDLEEPPGKIVSIENMPGSPLALLGCTDAGDILTWKHNPGTIERSVGICFPEVEAVVKSFRIIPFDHQYFALVTWICEEGACVQMGIFDLISGIPKQMNLLQLEEGEHKVAVSRNNHNIVAVIQNHKLFVARLNSRKGTNKSSSFTNAGREVFTAVACHPVDETVAVGDRTGKIFIYYELFKKRTTNPATTLYHWHHNQVETIAFTSSGSLFYSGGAERVLVGWNYNDEGKNVLPRLNGKIVHVAVSSDNQQIAISTDDNGIIIISPQFKDIAIIQNFVRVADDRTPWPPLPLGLKLDPRTGCIVLNGRTGQIQFFSPYDRTFFNLDVTMENRLSLERDKLLYNTRITHVACNVDWLVTAECLNDLVNFPEVRLKFWLFDVTTKTYVLSTQIETPHEGGVTALEFSRSSRVDNLLCASSGSDGKVKMWSLEESEVYNGSPDLANDNTATKTVKYWVCLEKTSYKNLAVNSLAFSPDGSLLAVGFGNTLCIYIAETLRIKAVLSAPSGQDGSTNKVIVSVPKPNMKTQRNRQAKSSESREETVRKVKNFLENDDDQLLNDLIKKTENATQETQNGQMTEMDGLQIDEKEKKNLFDRIIALNELNFYQKLEIFQKLNIHIRIHADFKILFHKYVRDNMSVAHKENVLRARSKTLSSNTKFIGRWMLHNYLTRRNEETLNGLHLKNVTFVDDKMTDDVMEIECSPPKSTVKPIRKVARMADKLTEIECNELKSSVNPVRKVASIKHIVFATGSCCHLVIVCTENRLLIWNLQTSRLEVSCKLSVRFIVVDPCTSLVAAFTFCDELYVFNPSKPYVLYQHQGMPKTVGAVWLPRREPKQQSLDVDWQSISQLFFLTRSQELLYLNADNDEDLFGAVRSASLKEVNNLEPQTHFGAMIAKQITNDAASFAGQRNLAGGLIGEPTKNSVKAIINLQTHTMAPVHLLSYGFLTSLLSKEIVQSKDPSRNQNEDDDIEMIDDSENDDSGELNRKISERKQYSRLESTVSRSSDENRERKNAELNGLLNEKPKFGFSFASQS